ncbi:MAG: hypothetical protein HOP19_21915 [Acidobacteria bacterium]|nr:hypothetical protein [Acidobacteriota bacterium]
MENSLPDIEAEKSDFLTQEWIDEWYEEKLQEMRAALRQQTLSKAIVKGCS